VLNLLSGKYSPFILKELMNGTLRFGELRQRIPGISPKTLSERLKYYIGCGIINRHSYPEIPPRVEYQLTERGESLKTLILDLEHLANNLDTSHTTTTIRRTDTCELRESAT
jgi:DNA-binding HxlR family transcriptional regulator